jgi:hypothetical protein
MTRNNNLWTTIDFICEIMGQFKIQLILYDAHLATVLSGRALSEVTRPKEKMPRPNAVPDRVIQVQSPFQLAHENIK